MGKNEFDPGRRRFILGVAGCGAVGVAAISCDRLSGPANQEKKETPSDPPVLVIYTPTGTSLVLPETPFLPTPQTPDTKATLTPLNKEQLLDKPQGWDEEMWSTFILSISGMELDEQQITSFNEKYKKLLTMTMTMTPTGETLTVNNSPTPYRTMEATLTPTATLAPIPTSEPTATLGVVYTPTPGAVAMQNANVRKGPGTGWEVMAGVKEKMSMRITRIAENGWIEVVLDNGQRGWVLGTFLNLNEGAMALEKVGMQEFPTPVPTLTATPRPTAALRPSLTPTALVKPESTAQTGISWLPKIQADPWISAKGKLAVAVAAAHVKRLFGLDPEAVRLAGTADRGEYVQVGLRDRGSCAAGQEIRTYEIHVGLDSTGKVVYVKSNDFGIVIFSIDMCANDQ